MRDTVSPLRGANLSVLAHCVGNALKAVYRQADVCRQDLLLEIESNAAHPMLFMSGQRD
jgi:hypothetical protein